MQVSLYSVGRKMPAWVQAGCDEYIRRLPRRWRFQLREFPQAQDNNPDVIRQREADSLLSAIAPQAHVVALDNLGKSWSTVELSNQLQHWQQLGKDIVLLIGGPDGLHPRCRERSNQLWSLSPLTFPHPLVRVIATEQLYRAQSLLDNHPYHRA